nr:2,3-bisphosphoglycerate-independent phosphoglycerate mutase [Pseudomonadota bacterium]
HIVNLARILSQAGVPAAVHCFLDGRDVPPSSARDFIAKFRADVSQYAGVHIVTLSGRYYAMDRDKRWERVEKAYQAMVHAAGEQATDPVKAIEDSYGKGVTDEFVLPTVMGGYRGMKDGDGILMANFRADRAREILSALLDPAFTGFARPAPVKFTAAAGMVEYSTEHARLMSALFPPKDIRDSLGEVISRAGLKQLRIAETEKYPHVTFFFNGGVETPYPGEERILVPSPRVATYDEKPEMSAFEVTDRLLEAMDTSAPDLVVLNFANLDMVGHTGDLKAAIRAVETIDQCLGRIVTRLKEAGGAMILTSDHGNCEQMYDHEHDQPHTAHTLNPVPVILVNGPPGVQLHGERLADIAPTILALMGLDIPAEMTGRNMLVSAEAGA